MGCYAGLKGVRCAEQPELSSILDDLRRYRVFSSSLQQCRQRCWKDLGRRPPRWMPGPSVPTILLSSPAPSSQSSVCFSSHSCSNWPFFACTPQASLSALEMSDLGHLLSWKDEKDSLFCVCDVSPSLPSDGAGYRNCSPSAH